MEEWAMQGGPRKEAGILCLPGEWEKERACITDMDMVSWLSLPSHRIWGGKNGFWHTP